MSTTLRQATTKLIPKIGISIIKNNYLKVVAWQISTNASPTLKYNETLRHTRQHKQPFNYPRRPVPERQTNLDFTKARDSKWQWHQLDYRQDICSSLHTANHASTPPLSFFAGLMPFLPPNQQHQSTECTRKLLHCNCFTAHCLGLPR